MREEAREIFDTPDAITGLSWVALHKRIEGIHKIKRSGSRKRFDKLKKAGLIKKNAAGLYTR
jgi:hypothetical protein